MRVREIKGLILFIIGSMLFGCGNESSSEIEATSAISDIKVTELEGNTANSEVYVKYTIETNGLSGSSVQTDFLISKEKDDVLGDGSTFVKASLCPITSDGATDCYMVFTLPMVGETDDYYLLAYIVSNTEGLKYSDTNISFQQASFSSEKIEIIANTEEDFAINEVEVTNQILFIDPEEVNEIGQENPHDLLGYLDAIYFGESHSLVSLTARIDSINGTLIPNELSSLQLLDNESKEYKRVVSIDVPAVNEEFIYSYAIKLTPEQNVAFSSYPNQSEVCISFYAGLDGNEVELVNNVYTISLPLFVYTPPVKKSPGSYTYHFNKSKMLGNKKVASAQLLFDTQLKSGMSDVFSSLDLEANMYLFNQKHTLLGFYPTVDTAALNPFSTKLSLYGFTVKVLEKPEIVIPVAEHHSDIAKFHFSAGPIPMEIEFKGVSGFGANIVLGMSDNEAKIEAEPYLNFGVEASGGPSIGVAAAEIFGEINLVEVSLPVQVSTKYIPVGRDGGPVAEMKANVDVELNGLNGKIGVDIIYRLIKKHHLKFALIKFHTPLHWTEHLLNRVWEREL